MKNKLRNKKIKEKETVAEISVNEEIPEPNMINKTGSITVKEE